MRNSPPLTADPPAGLPGTANDCSAPAVATATSWREPEFRTTAEIFKRVPTEALASGARERMDDRDGIPEREHPLERGGRSRHEVRPDDTEARHRGQPPVKRIFRGVEDRCKR